MESEYEYWTGAIEEINDMVNSKVNRSYTLEGPFPWMTTGLVP